MCTMDIVDCGGLCNDSGGAWNLDFLLYFFILFSVVGGWRRGHFWLL